MPSQDQIPHHSFSRRGKSKIIFFRAWQNAQNYGVLTETFQQLPSETSIVASLPILQQFLVATYGETIANQNLDDFRLDLFNTASSNNIREIPPSRQGLNLHIRRSAYQSGWVWGNTTPQEPIPSAVDFGWKVNSNQLAIVWSSTLSGDLFERITRTCSCKSGPSSSSNRCKSCVCGKNKVSCIDQCKSKRSCAKRDK